MKIVDAMKNPEVENIRLSFGSRWMVWIDIDNEWYVCERFPYARVTTILCQTPHESKAIKELIKE